MLEKLLEEIQQLQEAKELLNATLAQCAGYGYIIPGMSPELQRRIQKFMNFDDSE